MKYHLPALLFLVYACQVKRTVVSRQETFPNGKVRLMEQTVIQQNKEFELHENFREETRIKREYYSNGKLKYELKIVYHNGFELPCREALYRLAQFDSLGHKKYFLETECDCHRYTEITYNKEGKILIVTKKIIKRIY